MPRNSYTLIWSLLLGGLAAALPATSRAASSTAATTPALAARAVALAAPAAIAATTAPPSPTTPTAPAAAPPAPRVRVDSGILVGAERDGMIVFAGIPFAAPPVGELRWRAPQPPAAWRGERAATSPGANCMQKPGPDGVSLGGGPVSEDCLTLSVSAPRGARAAPVMVWLHGGGNTGGSGSKTLYDGTSFARDGVVLVTLNYRLGAFGFFAHPALSRAAAAGEPLANFALLDQIAALRWVQRNIAAFGGDPARVTVFGESAGGGDLIALLTIAAARGLFAQAIAESAGGGWEPLPTLAAAEGLGERIATQAGLPANASAVALRALPADRLLAAQVGEYAPILDGRLITENTTAAFAAGRAARVPLLIGSNSYEASLLRNPALMLQETSAETRATYTAAGTDIADDATLGAAIFGDRFFTAPARWFARRAAAAGAPVWLYSFSYVRTSQRSKTPGAPHGSELPYVFDSWDKISLRAAFLPTADRAMTALVHTAWITFAKTGTPAAPSLPAWPPYNAQRDELLDLGATPALRAHFRRAQLDAQERAAAATLPTAPTAH